MNYRYSRYCSLVTVGAVVHSFSYQKKKLESEGQSSHKLKYRSPSHYGLSMTSACQSNHQRPAAAATWKFGDIAIEASIDLLRNGGSSIDAVVKGIRAVELDNNEQYYVGVGGLPNADGDMELDSAIMDHRRRYGAVMGLQKIMTPIEVARVVMEKSEHNVFCGDGALQFAKEQGFQPQPEVLTQKAREEWLQWKRGEDLTPSPHDTIGLICIDSQGRLCAGTSTSGWKFKHPGRVGDSPLIGSGLYCDGNYGAAVATGDGEEIMRTCLSFIVVEMMRQGKSPREACVIGIQRMLELETVYTVVTPAVNTMHSSLIVGVVAMDKHGNVGAASTLDENNKHRGHPYFTAPFLNNPSINTPIKYLKASLDGDGV